jgi:hypothetical protein
LEVIYKIRGIVVHVVYGLLLWHSEYRAFVHGRSGRALSITLVATSSVSPGAITPDAAAIFVPVTYKEQLPIVAG